MFDPYRMIFVNILASVILLCGCIIYRYIYPKKKVNLLTLLILLSLLPLLSLLRPGDYESGDFNIHVYRSIDFYNSLQEGQIIPSWAGNLNASYGYPLFIFINSLPYYLVSFFHFFGFSFIVSMKIFLGMTFIFSGIFMYLWTYELFKNKLAAFTAGVFYLFTPYHLVDLHFRASVGELSIFMTLPLLLVCITKLIKQQTLPRLLCTSIATALVILSHQAVAIFSLCLVGIYTLFSLITTKKFHKKTLLMVILAFSLGIVLSSPALFPYLTYMHYTIASEFNTVAFTPIHELIYAPWRGGFLFQGPRGELSPLIGYIQLVVIALSGYVLIRNKKRKNYAHRFFWFAVAIFLIFLMTPYSKIIWDTVPLIKLTLISTRMLLLLTVCIAILAALLVLTYKNQKIAIIVVIIITIMSTMLNWGHRRVIPEIDDSVLKSNIGVSTNNGEGWGIGIPIWQETLDWEKKKPSKNLEVINGKAEIQTLSRSSVTHTYVIYAATPVTVKENTWYFPGWSVTIDDKKTPIHYENPPHKGYINFNIEKGLHYIDIKYEDPSPLHTVKIIALMAWGGVLLMLLLYFLKPLLYKKLFKMKRRKNG